MAHGLDFFLEKKKNRCIVIIVLDIDNLIYSPLLRIEVPVYEKAA